MKIVIGSDIVSLNEFKKSVFNGGELFIRKVFQDCELENPRFEHKIGLFAAKEAIIKALSLPPGCWLLITIKNKTDGRPYVIFSKKIKNNFKSYDLSISHSGVFTIAVFVAVL